MNRQSQRLDDDPTHAVDGLTTLIQTIVWAVAALLVLVFALYALRVTTDLI